MMDFVIGISHIIDNIRPWVILSILSILFFVENIWRCQEQPKNIIKQSYQTNITTLLFNDVVVSALSITTLLTVAQQYNGHYAPVTDVDFLRQFAWSLILLDLLLYGWHRMCHTVNWLWMFHKVHHSDLVMNVTTAFRLHVVEVLMTLMVKIGFVVVTGIDAVIITIHELIMAVCVMFHHTNISFSQEKWLGQVFITPYLHRVHHSVKRKEHDTNYGQLFSLWDKIFNTFKEVVPTKIGLTNIVSQSFVDLFMFGLTPMPTPRPVVRLPHNINQMIAEAAYYRAEKRGFNSGEDQHDWFEAEREIMSKLCR